MPFCRAVSWPSLLGLALLAVLFAAVGVSLTRPRSEPSRTVERFLPLALLNLLLIALAWMGARGHYCG